MKGAALVRVTSIVPLALLPTLAAACPACARDGSPHLAEIVGAKLLVPFALAGGVVWALRRGDPEEDR